MKVIELLTKIANGEEVPKKIRFDDMIWNKMCGEKNIYYINEYDSDLFVYFFRRNITFDLNDEIEIIEDKKIEKLDVDKIYERKYLCDDISIDNLRLVNKRLSNNWDKLRKWLSDKYYGLNGHMDSDIIEIKDVLNYINELKGVENNE